ncbi:MAG TPA: hypothetical protein V6C58_23855 [Allocoleopsis sp.]
MPRSHRIKCPKCGDTAGRVHRQLSDRLIGIFKPNKRYRCFNPDCNWEGLEYEQRSNFTTRTAIRQLKRRRAIQALVITGVATVAGLTIAKMFTSNSQKNSAPRNYN